MLKVRISTIFGGRICGVRPVGAVLVTNARHMKHYKGHFLARVSAPRARGSHKRGWYCTVKIENLTKLGVGVKHILGVKTREYGSYF